MSCVTQQVLHNYIVEIVSYTLLNLLHSYVTFYLIMGRQLILLKLGNIEREVLQNSAHGEKISCVIYV